jgi:hypothetical protein
MWLFTGNVSYLSICLRALLIPLLAIATLAWRVSTAEQSETEGRPVAAARCCFGELTCLNVQFGVLSSVASFHGGIISARALPKLEPGWNRSRCDCFCDPRRAYLRLFVQLTLERHDFDKRSVVGMTEKRKLKVTVSTLDRFHDESEYRLPISARYIVDSEGVTPGREVNADYTIRPEPSETLRSLKEIVEASPVAELQRRSLGKTAFAVLQGGRQCVREFGGHCLRLARP